MQNQSGRLKNVLCVYAASQTYTATVFEHLDSFRKYSRYEWSFLDISIFNIGKTNLDLFDTVVLHYSVRLPFGQLSKLGQQVLQNFRGLKVLFIQDEYDNTNTVKKIIKNLPFNLVFSVVPPHSMEKIYPVGEFDRTRFVNNLTGYVPDDLAMQLGDHTPTASRPVVIAYRGRPLPIRYGKLGQEKISIGKSVRSYCQKHKIAFDIEWSESSRIYGEKWYRFIGSAKAMLGSESGSNVFDWDGSLQHLIDSYVEQWPRATQAEIYQNVVEKTEIEGLMNQISPRIFEMAAAKTVMVLFEGQYSDVLVPNTHYLSLKKDFSNLDDIFSFLANDDKIEEMAERTYEDIIQTGKYSYSEFVNMIDLELAASFDASPFLSSQKVQPYLKKEDQSALKSAPFRSMPLRAKPLGKFAIAIWQWVPISFRPYIKKLLGRT